MKRFSEVDKREPVFPDTEYMTDKNELKGKQLVFIQFKEVEGSSGKYAVVQASLDGKAISFSIGGVVYEQLRRNAKELPFEAVFTEEKSADGRLYYTLK